MTVVRYMGWSCIGKHVTRFRAPDAVGMQTPGNRTHPPRHFGGKRGRGLTKRRGGLWVEG